MNRLVASGALALLVSLAAAPVALAADDEPLAPAPAGAGAASPHRAEQKAAGRRTSNVDILKELDAKTDVTADRMPLNKFVQMLSDQHKIPFMLDAGGLDRANVQPDTPITASYLELPLSISLRQILRRLNLRHYVRNGKVVITDRMIRAAAAPAPVPIRQQVLPGGQVMIMNGQQAMIVNGRIFQNQPQQVVQQMQPVAQVELIFVKRICAPTKEQMRQIKNAMQEYVKQAGDEFTVSPNGLVRRDVGLISTASQLVQEKLKACVQSRLSREQAARYRSELEKRDAWTREVWARNLVALLDRELCLSAKQRKDLFAALLVSWNDTWSQSVQMARLNGNNFVPSIPDDVIVPVLDPAQVDLWESVPKVANVNWGAQALPRDGLGMPAAELEDDE